MTRPIYDPTAHCLLADAHQVSDESGLQVVRSPHTNQWFVLDPWTWKSRPLADLPSDARASVDEVIRIEQIGSTVDESSVDAMLSGWFDDQRSREPRNAAGGVVIDDQSRVLLRAPRGAYGGYVWTFPKGRLDQGETWPQAALREVEEETGWRCRIVMRIGTYRGDTTNTRFYLMTPIGKAGKPDAETEEVVWVRVLRAVQLLSKTRTPRGRVRDLTVLRDALVLHDQKFGTELHARVSWPLARLLKDAEPVDEHAVIAPRPRVRVVLPAALLV